MLMVLLLSGLVWSEAAFSNTIKIDSHFSVSTIPEYHEVNENIIRGGRPQVGDLEKLFQQGVRTIINIDNDSKTAEIEKKEADRLGLNYINSPMSAFSTPNDQQVDEILSHLNDTTLFPIFIHCQHGQDRTGMILGLYRYQTDKWSAQAAYDEMLNFGFHKILRSLDSYFKSKTNF